MTEIVRIVRASFEQEFILRAELLALSEEAVKLRNDLEQANSDLAALREVIVEKEARWQRISSSLSWRMVSYARSIINRYPLLRAGTRAAFRRLLLLRRMVKRLHRR